jgi:hypothetical protein
MIKNDILTIIPVLRACYERAGKYIRASLSTLEGILSQPIQNLIS